MLRGLNLFRRKNKSPINAVIEFIHKNLMESGSCFGYRVMHNKLLTHGYVVDRETVRIIISSLDPEGVQLRTANRLRRRIYRCKAPNHIWHLDGYDKLKPFGFAIHGAIDGFSRRE